MSWPADGLPRFIVTECSGHPMVRQGNQYIGREGGVELLVLDRAFAHRIVWRQSSRTAHAAQARVKAARARERLERQYATAEIAAQAA